ncbi:hypothetical protein CEXT_339131 [Caerostris extrusa]|uniref:Uncharacterized protein n=1 Tax=Caerostris extrusa TaxID=172846 RepID=A0AAV4SAB8_CAEEX|nr:hypothetical protein CEXT_339131 [Caerostris extrusa]
MSSTESQLVSLRCRTINNSSPISSGKTIDSSSNLLFNSVQQKLLVFLKIMDLSGKFSGDVFALNLYSKSWILFTDDFDSLR